MVVAEAAGGGLAAMAGGRATATQTADNGALTPGRAPSLVSVVRTERADRPIQSWVPADRTVWQMVVTVQWRRI